MDGRLDLSLVTAFACGLALVALWLFGVPSFGAKPLTLEPPVGYERMPHVDGSLKVVEERELVLRPFRPVDGRREVRFEVRDADANRFDMAHLRAHSAIGVPTRIYYERDGDRYVARWKTDAPVNSARR
jgi:hypothetical protein